ncbi:hypothetical protein [Lacipirellula sp.]|uniref:hypothetical protein n=1 Tax=Lacipirellula sp. TaxID=2691419 RepID=UPI003D147B46
MFRRFGHRSWFGVALLLLFVFVWPTPYTYKTLQKTWVSEANGTAREETHEILLQVNRFTGANKTVASTESGWELTRDE